MVAHLPAARAGIRLQVGIAVQLSEEGADVGHPRRPHERLVPVVPGAPVARAERLGHRELGDFLAVAEDAEGGVAAQDLSPPADARAAAAVDEAVGGGDIFAPPGTLVTPPRPPP